MRLLACLLAMVLVGCGRGSGTGGNGNSMHSHDAGTPTGSDDAGAAMSDSGVDAGPASDIDAGIIQGAICPAGLGDAGTVASSDGGDLDASVASADCDGLTPPPVGVPLAFEEGPFGWHGECLGGTADGSGNVALLFDGDTTEYPNPIGVNLFDRSGVPIGAYQGRNSGIYEQLSGYLILDGLDQHTLTAIDTRG